MPRTGVITRIIRTLVGLALLRPLAGAQTNVSTAGSQDPLQALDFLIGTWSAQTSNAGSAGATAIGTYSFHRDLAGHVLQRTGSTDSCTGSKSFDCQHGDQLTIFSDPGNPHGGGLYALYLDSEGHVIHYTVTMPDPQSVLFTSQGSAAGPHFRLTYRLTGSGAAQQMTGRFEGAAPGSGEFHPYLTWTGKRQ